MNKEDLWWDYGISKVEKLRENNGDWSKLSLSEREAAALWKFQVDVANGGFLQFLCNWGYENYEYAVAAIKNIKAPKTLQLTQDAYKTIAYLEHKDIENLWDIYPLLSREATELLNEIDNQLWNCEEDTAELAYDYYCN